MAWYFQSSPHDTHDWDSTQTPVLFDGEINGQPRKLLAQAARNGHFFVLDRATGKALVSSEYVKTNWSNGYDAKGQPIPNPAKDPQIDGALVSPNQGGATNWPPPSFSPQTGLFYVSAGRAYSVYYIYDPSENPQGWGGTDRGGWSESMLQAIDYKTGKVRWSHKWEGDVRRRRPEHGRQPRVHRRHVERSRRAQRHDGRGAVARAPERAGRNGPITYELDGMQYVLVGAGDTLWAFVMNEQRNEAGLADSGLAGRISADPESAFPSPPSHRAPSPDYLSHRKRDRRDLRTPLDLQRPALRRVVDRDGYLLGWGLCLLQRHRGAADLEGCVVGNTPLAGFPQLAHEQLPILLARLGVQRIGPGLEAQRAELQRLIGLEQRGFVGAGTPGLSNFHEARAVLGASLQGRPPVFDRDVGPVDGPLRADVRAATLARMNLRRFLSCQRSGCCHDQHGRHSICNPTHQCVSSKRLHLRSVLGSS